VRRVDGHRCREERIARRKRRRDREGKGSRQCVEQYRCEMKKGKEKNQMRG